MNRLLAGLSRRSNEEDGCCEECSPKCRSKKLRAQSRDRALAFRAGLS